MVDGEEQSQGKTQKAATKTGTISSLSFPFSPKILPTHIQKEKTRNKIGAHEELEKNIK